MRDLNHYKKEKLTINLTWANIFIGVLLFPVLLVFGTPFYLRWHNQIDVIQLFKAYDPPQIFLGLFAAAAIGVFGVVVHELIHGAVWGYYAKEGFKSIKFGVVWKMLTPYCHCKEPLKVRAYILGALAPAIVLGVIPALWAIWNGSLVLLVFGVYFTMAAGGDFLVINLLRKESKSALVQDHPSEAGCYIYRDQA